MRASRPREANYIRRINVTGLKVVPVHVPCAYPNSHPERSLKADKRVLAPAVPMAGATFLIGKQSRGIDPKGLRAQGAPAE